MTWPLFDSSLADGFRVGAAARILLNDGLSQLRIFCPATPADSIDPGTKISDRRALSAGRLAGSTDYRPTIQSAR